ncbi:MAG TPA: hypothetical protein VN837_05465 [Chloroflexota bacterium]|nr:hypothetical protein [Chloroflexota bacterium]
MIKLHIVWNASIGYLEGHAVSAEIMTSVGEYTIAAVIDRTSPTMTTRGKNLYFRAEPGQIFIAYGFAPIQGSD